MLFISAILALSSIAHAEVDEGGWTIKSDGNTIGSMQGVGDDVNPCNPTVPDKTYWDWSGTAWPSNDFRLEPDVEASVTCESSDEYDSADFPSSATHQLPGSLGQNDKMYAISVCDSGGCNNAGFLWVVNGGATLKWFLRSDWSGDRLSASTGEWVHFDHLVSAPGTQDYFRYLSHAQY